MRFLDPVKGHLNVCVFEWNSERQEVIVEEFWRMGVRPGTERD